MSPEINGHNGHANGTLNGHNRLNGRPMGSPPPAWNPDRSAAYNAYNTACWALSKGLWPVPITPHDSTLTSSPGKAPMGKAWGAKKRSKGYFKAIYEHNPTAGLGLKLGSEGLIIDIDEDDPELAADTLARIFPGGLPNTLGFPSNRGRHFLFLYDPRFAEFDPIIKATVRGGEITGHVHYPGVEIRLGAKPGSAKQIQTVIPPSCRADGTPRAWNGNPVILPAPESLFEDLARYGKVKVSAGKPSAPAPAPEKATHKRAAGGNRPDAVTRAIAWIKKCEPGIEGQRGSDKALWAAMVGPFFDLDAETTIKVFTEHYASTCTPPWTDPEQIRHKVEEAFKLESTRGKLLDADREPTRAGKGNSNTGGKPEDSAIASGCEAFRNYELTEDEDGKPIQDPLSIHDLDYSLRSIMGDWPKRVGDQLFAETPDHQKITLNSSTKLFAWINNKVHVDWTKGNERVPQDRYYEHRRMNATAYDAIETLPHWPPIEGVYYMHEPVPDSTGGGLLDQLLSYFNPSSDVDRELIRAYILTLFWGGPPGSRPAFLTTGPDVDSEQGRGVGKSTIVELLANGLANGFLEVSPNVEMHKIDERLLSPGARQIRVVRIDNIKTDRFSWGDLEGRITSPVISGRELYEGEGRRPNTLVFNLTLNGASLSKDMAQRTIVIKLARPPKIAGWKESVVAFIKSNRLGLLAEIRDALLDEPGAFPAATRWAEWERDVLSKTDNIKACQDTILERQAEIDNDREEQDIVAGHFAERISGHGYDPKRVCVQITAQAVADWLSKATGEIYSVKKATTHLKRLGIEQLTHKRKNTGVIWTWTAGPVDANRPNGPIKW